MLIKTKPINLIQIFYKILLESEVIWKIVIAPDDNFEMELLSMKGLIQYSEWSDMATVKIP